MKHYKSIAIVVLTLVLTILSGCGNTLKDNNSSDIPKEHASTSTEDTITLLYSASDTFNPYTAATQTNRQICRLLYEPLVKLNNQFEVSYSLAKDIKLDGLTCTVTLNHRLFSDGTTVTADDVVYSYNLAKKSSSEYAYKLYEVSSVSANGSNVVIFKITRKDPYFINLLDFPILKKDSENRSDSDSVKLPPIGCGSYVVNKSRNGLILNEKSVGSNYAVKKINLINAPDNESVTHYVEIGAADMYYTDISDGKILRMSGNKIDVNINHLVYIGINKNHDVLKLKELRQAISSGINRNAICTESYYNNAISATGFFNPVWKEANSVQNIQTVANEEITVENLKEIGYNNLDSTGVLKNSNGTRLKFELLVNSENRLRVSAAHLIAKQLSQYGIKINVVEKSFAKYNEDLTSGNFQLYLGEIKITPNMDISNLVVKGGSAAFGYAQNTTTSPSDGTNNNTSSEVDKKEPIVIDSLINGFYNGINTIADISAILQTEMPVVPICYRTGVLFYNDKIENITDSSASNIYFSIKSYTINN